VRPFKERINEEFIERAKKLLIGYSKKAPKDANRKNRNQLKGHKAPL